MSHLYVFLPIHMSKILRGDLKRNIADLAESQNEFISLSSSAHWIISNFMPRDYWGENIIHIHLAAQNAKHHRIICCEWKKNAIKKYRYKKERNMYAVCKWWHKTRHATASSPFFHTTGFYYRTFKGCGLKSILTCWVGTMPCLVSFLTECPAGLFWSLCVYEEEEKVLK